MYELRICPVEMFLRSGYICAMNSKDIADLRLVNQRLARTAFTTPQQVVKWMGCIQAQDYAMAKWAVGCRLLNPTAAAIEQDFNEGKILRTHVLRPTWHFICPDDIRWMLRLSAPRIRVLARPYHRQLGIDATLLQKSKKVLVRALEQHKKLSRPQLMEILKKEKIDTSDARMGHLLMDAELDALICSAGRIGRQFAYGLLDEQAQGLSQLSDEEAIVRLAGIYFPSRGPATVQDFAWWAGLTMTDARKGLDACKSALQSERFNGFEYWFAPGAGLTGAVSADGASADIPATYLLPAFDEFTVAYKHRDDVLDPQYGGECFYGLKPVVVHNGKVVGTWTRTEKKGMVEVETTAFRQGKGVPVRAMRGVKKKYVDFSLVIK
jgi:hypothetical protein